MLSVLRKGEEMTSIEDGELSPSHFDRNPSTKCEGKTAVDKRFQLIRERILGKGTGKSGAVARIKLMAISKFNRMH